VDMRENPWAACAVRVDPGLYRLSLRAPKGDLLAGTVVAAPTWQTQLFLLQRSYGSERETRADLPGTSVMLSGAWQFDAGRRTTSFGTGTARAEERSSGLPQPTHKRHTPREVCDPMLGLFGAHLLLRQTQKETSVVRENASGEHAQTQLPELGEVVRNLRLLVGPRHPDVEALALLLPSEDSSYVFDSPPVLRKTWSLILDATVKRPELVPVSSFASRVANRFMTDEPWPLWTVPEDLKGVHAITTNLAWSLNSLAQSLAVAPQTEMPPPPSPPSIATAPILRGWTW
jgi:hypothetical protein